MYKPGVYEVEITGTAVGSSPLLEKPATFLLTLEDPCDPPNSVSSVTLGNQVYTLTDASATPYVHPEFTIDPDYCLLEYSYSQTFLADGDTALVLPTPANNDRTFNFSYSKDLAPLGQTQTVTITATSSSKHGVVNPTESDHRTFDLTFKNPCLDTTFVNIAAPTLTN